MNLYLTEEISDQFGSYTCNWYCPVPAKGVTYRVLRELWNNSCTERNIYEIQEIQNEHRSGVRSRLGNRSSNSQH